MCLIRNSGAPRYNKVQAARILGLCRKTDAYRNQAGKPGLVAGESV